MPDLNDKIVELGRTIAAFQKTNDERLDAIEKTGSADVLVEEKTNKINSAITEVRDEIKEIKKAMARPTAASEEVEEKTEIVFAHVLMRKNEVLDLLVSINYHYG